MPQHVSRQPLQSHRYPHLVEDATKTLALLMNLHQASSAGCRSSCVFAAAVPTALTALKTATLLPTTSEAAAADSTAETSTATTAGSGHCGGWKSRYRFSTADHCVAAFAVPRTTSLLTLWTHLLKPMHVVCLINRPSRDPPLCRFTLWCWIVILRT